MGTIESLCNDCFNIVLNFLNGEDVKELRLVNKELNARCEDRFYNYWFIANRVKYNFDKVKKIRWANDYEVIKFNNLTHLTFGYNFNQPIDNLPGNLTHLILRDAFDQPVDNLPPNLTHLTLGRFFNQPVNNVPSTLTHLIFDFYFDQPVDNLPLGLTHLTFGNDFDQNVNHLPNSLKHLILGDCFDQSIDNLPSGLIHLELGEYFNRPIGNFPPNLEYLTLGTYFNQSLNNLPSTLTYFSLFAVLGKDNYFDMSIDNLPLSLSHMTIVILVNVWILFGQPSNIKTHSALLKGYQSIEDIPSELSHSDFTPRFNSILENLPKNIVNYRIKTAIHRLRDIYPSPDFIRLIFTGKFTDLTSEELDLYETIA